MPDNTNFIETDWAAKWAIYRPDALAFKDLDSGQQLSFSELNQRAEMLAYYCQEVLQLPKGSRLFILAENGLAYSILFALAQKMGYVLVPANYRLSPPEIAYIFQDAEPALLIVEAQFDGKLSEVKRSIPRWLWEEVMQLSEPGQQAPTKSKRESPAWEDPIFLLYTSGTTGFPKGVCYTHQMLFWNSINTALSLVVNTESRTLNVMPPFHTGGWNVLTTPFFHHGGYTAMLRKFDAERVLQLLQEEEASIFMAVPTMLKMMAAADTFRGIQLPQLRYILVGGEALPLPLIAQWEEKGVPIRQGYGMTEAGPNLTSLHQSDASRKKGSIGRPNFYVQTRIVDETGRDCPPGQAGELLLRGPMVFPRYWKNPTATEKAFSPDGWFKTGDTLLQDEEGYLYVVGRIKEMYISGGENVYPAEVERWLLTHPSIAAAAVIGVEDKKWGEVGHAFLVLQKGQDCSAEAIAAYCQKGLAKYKVPKHCSFLAALPQNGSGKIDRQALKRMAGG